MFLWIVIQEENPRSIAKFHTIAKSLFIFLFIVSLLLLIFFKLFKMKKKFWGKKTVKFDYLLKVNERNTRRW